MCQSTVYPNCLKILSLPDTAAGRKVRCPKCGSAFVAPKPDPLSLDDAEQPPSEPAPLSLDLPTSTDREERPARRQPPVRAQGIPAHGRCGESDRRTDRRSQSGASLYL